MSTSPTRSSLSRTCWRRTSATNKYAEITSECAIRGTWCDLGIKIEGKFLFLIEVKAIGLELKDQYIKQAVDYAANQGQLPVIKLLDRLGPSSDPDVLYTDNMKVWLDLSDHVVAHITAEGQDLSQAALEALAIDAYRMNRITGYQLSQLLKIPTRHELDAFLKYHGVPLEYIRDDFEREGATSARLWQKRQAEIRVR